VPCGICWLPCRIQLPAAPPLSARSANSACMTSDSMAITGWSE
jgi:hypothetical protein